MPKRTSPEPASNTPALISWAAVRRRRKAAIALPPALPTEEELEAPTEVELEASVEVDNARRRLEQFERERYGEVPPSP